MNSKQASEIIGCHPTHINWLCRQGKLKCKEVPFRKGETGYRPGRTRWDISAAEVRRYAKTVDGRGGRGKKRS